MQHKILKQDLKFDQLVRDGTLKINCETFKVFPLIFVNIPFQQKICPRVFALLLGMATSEFRILRNRFHFLDSVL